jgi:hypothetical protein
MIMLVWCAILFGLGILAFLDSLFNYGEIFRRINSVLFLLVSLGLLIRTSMKAKLRYVENLQDRLEELETLVGPRLSQSEVPDRPKKQHTF